jgi:hypothetical protein
LLLEAEKFAVQVELSGNAGWLRLNVLAVEKRPVSAHARTPTRGRAHTASIHAARAGSSFARSAATACARVIGGA